MKTIKIGDRKIGERQKPYIIAEFGVNHNGSLDRAKEGIRQAASNGAQAIKFQTYTADELVVKGTPKFWSWDGDSEKKTQYDAYDAIGGFSYKHYPTLMKCCKDNDIEFLSTPFSFEAADFLNELGMKAFKVASSDMSHLPYLQHIARYQKPILLSTGAATMEEIVEAVQTIEKEGNDQIIILHCTLCYPTSSEDANLNLIGVLQKKFPMYPVGISDHTLGVFPAMIALAAGAKVLEKHFTVDKTLGESADHWLSIDPPELQQITCMANDIHHLMGSSEKKVFKCEQETRKYDKRSCVSKTMIHKGQTLKQSHIAYKRPGTGVWPSMEGQIIGKKAIIDIPADNVLQFSMFK